MKKYSIIILILCSWAMSLFAISCSDQESKPQPFLEIKKDTVVFAQEAANTSIVVNTNIAWQANVLSSGNWCTVQGSVRSDSAIARTCTCCFISLIQSAFCGISTSYSTLLTTLTVTTVSV